MSNRSGELVRVQKNAGGRISRLFSSDQSQKGTKVAGDHLTVLALCCGPTFDGKHKTDLDAQVHSMYDHLSELLGAGGAQLRDVVVEKIYLSDVDREFKRLMEIRDQRYNGGHRERYLPAGSVLQQPPCQPGQLCEIQAFAVCSDDDQALHVRTVGPDAPFSAGKIVEYGGYQHIYLSNLVGVDASGQPLDGFVPQAQRMFERAETLLGNIGASFPEVIRTWIYINDIDRDYEALNRLRTASFEENGVTRLPASTGIQAIPHPSSLLCAMDLYALLTDAPVEIEVMHAPTLNEAPDYGSSFSRGMKVTVGDRVVAYISGTASIDEQGRTVHLGDPEGQINRMLLNVEALLTEGGATLEDVAIAITYLKKPEYRDAFRKVCAQRSVPDFPNSLLVADICRPEWLCEIEAVAVYEK